jgi:K+-sensing histidine kinase KdpD
LKVLVIATDQQSREPWYEAFKDKMVSIDRANTAVEANDLFLSNLATEAPYQLVVLHHDQDSSDARQLMGYWRDQDLSFALIVIGNMRFFSDKALLDLGLMDVMAPDDNPQMLRNRLPFVFQAARAQQMLSLRAQILEESSRYHDPHKAISRAIQLISRNAPFYQTAFIAYTDREEEPIVQIYQDLDLEDQFWLEDLCSTRLPWLHEILSSGTRASEQGKTLVPIFSSRGWEGLLVFVVYQTDLFNPASAERFLDTLASSFHHLLEQVRHNQRAQKLARRKSLVFSILSKDIKNMFLEGAEEIDLIQTQAESLFGTEEDWIDQESFESLSQRIRRIREQFHFAQTLLEDLMDMHRIDEGMLVLQAKPFDLKGQIEIMLKTLQRRFKAKGINCLLSFQTKVTHTIEADEDKLKKALFNIFHFLFKHGEDRSKITLISQMEPTGTHLITLSMGTPLKGGLDPQTLFKVGGDYTELQGERFRLYICRKVIQAHEGRLWADLHEGKWRILIRLRKKMT